MITIYDVVLPLGILLAMLLSHQPRRAAIAFCLICLVSMIGVDYLTTGWAYYYASLFIELFAAMVLLGVGRYMKTLSDRTFFRILAAFFLASYAVTGLFIYDYIEAHTDYARISHVVAIGHVFTMLAYSDGIRNIVGNIRNRLFYPGFAHIDN